MIITNKNINNLNNKMSSILIQKLMKIYINPNSNNKIATIIIV